MGLKLVHQHEPVPVLNGIIMRSGILMLFITAVFEPEYSDAFAFPPLHNFKEFEDALKGTNVEKFAESKALPKKKVGAGTQHHMSKREEHLMDEISVGLPKFGDVAAPPWSMLQGKKGGKKGGKKDCKKEKKGKEKNKKQGLSEQVKKVQNGQWLRQWKSKEKQEKTKMNTKYKTRKKKFN